MERLHPKVTVTRLSPFFSHRGARIKLIVVHATESPRSRNGDRDLDNIGGWFQNRDAKVSAHVCTNGHGHSARYVHDHDKAWHVAGYNSVSLGIEQIGHTTDPHRVWGANREAQLKETARWIARWSKQYGVPVRKGRVWRGRVIRKGVVRHSDLGSIGGNHDDPGPQYPLGRVLDWAKWFRHRLH